jgi:hypothetical protein
MVDIFEKLSNMNKSMQCPQINTVNQNYKVNAVVKRLELWERNTECSILDMFHIFKDAVPERKPKTFHQPLGCFAETVFTEF